MKRIAFTFALLAGCYSPEVGDCQYRCDFSAEDPAKVCPDGMFCSVDDFCVSAPENNCGGPMIDSDMPPEDVGPPIDDAGDGGTMLDASQPDAGMPVDAQVEPTELVIEQELTTIREHGDDVSLAP